MVWRLLIIIFLATSNAVASEAAKVIRLRGEATQLAPGAKKARPIKLNSVIYEDTSILTHAKSFVVLEFSDGARMSVGPDSKVILVKTRTQDSGLVSLLKGKLRSQVKPDGSDRTKYIIRTKTTAMAVRGTDFQSTYNPSNSATSLVTFKGKVAMARIDTPKNELSVGTPGIKAITGEVERDEDGAPVVDELPQSVSADVTELNALFKHKNVVEVESGQYAGVLSGLKQPTQPVVINPAQATLLYNNNQFAPTEEGEKLEEVDFSAIKHAGSADAFYDDRTDSFRPRAGGFVDPDTGLYIPPREDSKLDEKTNIYIAKDVGYINRQTGDYVAPKGLILDPSLGFVAKNPEDKTLLAQAGLMNKTIAKDVLLKESPEEAPIIRPNKRERVAREALWLRLGPGGEELNVSADTITSDFSRKSENAFSFELGHDHAAFEGWQFLSRLGMQSVDFPTDGSVQQSGQTLWSFGVGLRRALSPDLSLSSTIALKQQFLYGHPLVASSTQNEWTRFTLPTIDLILESEVWRNRRLALLVDGGIVLTLPKSKADMDSKFGYGFILRPGVEWWTSGHMTVGMNFFVKRMWHKVESARFSNENEKSASGLDFRLSYYF